MVMGYGLRVTGYLRARSEAIPQPRLRGMRYTAPLTPWEGPPGKEPRGPPRGIPPGGSPQGSPPGDPRKGSPQKGLLRGIPTGNPPVANRPWRVRNWLPRATPICRAHTVAGLEQQHRAVGGANKTQGFQTAGLFVKLQDDHPDNKMIRMDFHRFHNCGSIWGPG